MSHVPHNNGSLLLLERSLSLLLLERSLLLSCCVTRCVCVCVCVCEVNFVRHASSIPFTFCLVLPVFYSLPRIASRYKRDPTPLTPSTTGGTPPPPFPSPRPPSPLRVSWISRSRKKEPCSSRVIAGAICASTSAEPTSACPPRALGAGWYTRPAKEKRKTE